MILFLFVGLINLALGADMLIYDGGYRGEDENRVYAGLLGSNYAVGADGEIWRDTGSGWRPIATNLLESLPGPQDLYLYNASISPLLVGKWPASLNGEIAVNTGQQYRTYLGHETTSQPAWPAQELYGFGDVPLLGGVFAGGSQGQLLQSTASSAWKLLLGSGSSAWSTSVTSATLRASITTSSTSPNLSSDLWLVGDSGTVLNVKLVNLQIISQRSGTSSRLSAICAWITT